MKSHRIIAGKFAVVLLFAAFGVAGALAQGQVVQFSASAYSVKESGATAKVTVTRSGGSAVTVTVDYATIDSGGGSAEVESDYGATSGTLTFGPGVTSQFFLVPVVEDGLHENNETIVVELSNPTGAGIGSRANATITISDNDPCLYTISPASHTLEWTGTGDVVPSIAVVATLGCDWTATEDADWIGIYQIIRNTDGTGEVIYTVDGNLGANSRSATITVAGKKFTVTQLSEPPPDVTAPTITFLTPAAGSRQTNTGITVTGRAADDVAVTSVEARVEQGATLGAWTPAEGTSSWSVAVSGLLPGTNTIRVRARDFAGNSNEMTRAVVHVEVSALTVVTNGLGSLTPFRNGQFLDVGKSYTVQARAAKTNFFTGWSGTVESTGNPFTFVMQPDFVLIGNFVPSPFIPVAGAYNGLITEEATNRVYTSGFFTATVTELGAFSARMTLGGKRLSFSGKFSIDGRATNTVTRSGTNALTVVLSVDLETGTDQINGTITDGDWSAIVTADRALYHKTTNPAPQAGAFTFIIPGDADRSGVEPGGDSYGTASVDASGNARLSGTLGDGTHFAHKAPISKDGIWPVYVPLYSGGGMVQSWVYFDPGDNHNFAGTLNWLKPVLPAAKFYSGGLALRKQLDGSRYRRPASSTDRVLSFADGRVQFSGGNLLEAFETPVALSENNKVTSSGTNNLKLSISTGSGLFSGSVLPPGTARAVTFKGVLLQKFNAGSGLFFGTNETGRMLFSE